MSAGGESFIEIRHVGSSPSRKTQRWCVSATAGEALGVVLWYAPWRCYVFEPLSSTIYEQRCLREIADFCEKATREHRAHGRHARLPELPEIPPAPNPPFPDLRAIASEEARRASPHRFETPAQ